MAKKKTPAKKRKVSGKRSSVSRRSAASQTDKAGVVGIVLVMLGILLLACQLIPSRTFVLEAVRAFLSGLSGKLCVMLPVLLAASGVLIIFRKKEPVSRQKLIGAGILFVVIETILEALQYKNVLNYMAKDGQSGALGFLIEAYRLDAASCKGGGLIGSLLAGPLSYAMDVWLTIIIMIFVSIIAIVVASGVSVSAFGMELSERIDEWRIERAERRAQAEAEQEEEQNEALERENVLAERRREKRQEQERARQEKQERLEAEKAEKARQAEALKNEREQARLNRQQELEAQERSKEAARLEVWGNSGIERPIYATNDPTRFSSPAYSAEKDLRELKIFDDQAFDKANESYEYDMRGQSAPDEPTAADPVRRRRGSAGAHPGVVDLPQYRRSMARPGTAAYSETGSASGAETPKGSSYGMPMYEPEKPAASEPAPETSSRTFEQNEPEDETIEDIGMYGLTVGEEPDPEDEEGPAPWDDEPVCRPVQPASGMPSSIPASGIPSRRAENQGTQLRAGSLDSVAVQQPYKDRHDEPLKAVQGQIYEQPSIELLKPGRSTYDPDRDRRLREGAMKLSETLKNFGVGIVDSETRWTQGPAITRYEIRPAVGVKVSRIVGLADDIALNMAAESVRIEAPIPGKAAVGIEIPNETISAVTLREILETPEWQKAKADSTTAVALGKGISGKPIIADLAKMPHVLIAGATGSGKSVCINTIINSIIYNADPKDVKLILIDPKVVELSVYNGIPHLLLPVVTDPKKASAALQWAVIEMEHRYKRFENMGVRDIKGYNRAVENNGEGEEAKMSKIIVIIDELADLMMVAPGEVEEAICRIAQLARAAGIHLVIATQRPSVNVITGVIKANIPSRIAFAVSSQIDSRTILDAGGAEKLLGKGDMLYMPQGASKSTRVQGCFVSDEEVQGIVDYLKKEKQYQPEYDQNMIDQMNAAAEEGKAAASDDQPLSDESSDDLFDKAVEMAVDAGQVSISMLQRKLRVGYARAGRLVDEMTNRGIVGEAEGSKPRNVLITREEWRRMQENQ